MKDFCSQIKDWYIAQTKVADEQFVLDVLTRTLFLKLSFPRLLKRQDDFCESVLRNVCQSLASPQNPLFANKILALPDGHTVGDSAFFGECGLFSIMDKFSFSSNEDSPDSVTPETIGAVFENVLSLFNPETKEESRKATGSFYTPREIIDYMIAESLKAELEQKLPEIPTKDLIDGKDCSCSQDETLNIVRTIYGLKCLDPACGSGSFLIRLSAKLLAMLDKIDADGTVQDSLISKNIAPSIAHLLAEQPKFTRALYLATHCIYGIDIQPMAIFITKLRFFSFFLNLQTSHFPLPDMDSNFAVGDFLLSDKKEEQIPLFETA